MENYRISSEPIELHSEEPVRGINNLISLTNNRIWIYYCGGLTQYWDLFDPLTKAPKLINSMKIAPGLYHLLPLSADKIAYYDHIAQRLKIIRLSQNKIDINYSAMLPTNNIIGNSERNDEKKIEEICRDYTKFLTLTTSETVITLEKSLINSNTSESVISVFRESHCPEPYKQKIHNNNTSTMAALNTEDTIVIYQLTLEKTHIFYMWNVFLDEKTMRKIIVKNDLSATVIRLTSFGLGKFAVWMNVKESGIPEVGIVDYTINENEKKESEMVLEYIMDRKQISHYLEDWMILEVILFDPVKEICLIAKSGQNFSLELLNLKNLKPFFSRNVENSTEDPIDYSQSPSLDMRYYVEYVAVLGDDIDEEDLDKSTNESESMMDGQDKMKVKLMLNTIVPLRLSLLNIFEKKKILEKYGIFLVNEIIDMLTLKEK